MRERRKLIKGDNLKTAKANKGRDKGESTKGKSLKNGRR